MIENLGEVLIRLLDDSLGRLVEGMADVCFCLAGVTSPGHSLQDLVIYEASFCAPPSMYRFRMFQEQVVVAQRI